MKLFKEELALVTVITLLVGIGIAIGNLKAGFALVALAFGIISYVYKQRGKDDGGDGK